MLSTLWLPSLQALTACVATRCLKSPSFVLTSARSISIVLIWCAQSPIFERMMEVITDEKMWQLWFSFFALPSVALADELGLFELLKLSSKSAHELASLWQANENAVQDWLFLLVAQGYLSSADNVKFCPTLYSEKFLLKNSKFYWGSALQYAYQGVKKRCPIRRALWQQGDDQFWSKMRQNPAQIELFGRSMQNIVAFAANNLCPHSSFSQLTNLLDLGCGNGAVAKAINQSHPQLKICLVDFEQVRSNLGTLPDSLQFFAADLWQDPWPKGYNNLLLSNYLHDLAQDRLTNLLLRARDYLPTSGQIFILDIFKSSPATFIPYAFSLYLGQILGSRVYSLEHIDQLLNQLGFQVELLGQCASYSLIKAQKM